MKFENKIALVTGASSGMGREIALRYAREGADVACAYYAGAAAAETQAAEAVVEEIHAMGRRAIGINFNQAKEEDIVHMTETVIREFGRVDILVNAAGVFIDAKPLCEITTQEFDFVMDVDIRGVFLVCRSIIPHMIKNGGGSIVNIGSASGVRANGLSPIPYVAAKFAMMGFTQEVDAEYGAKGIRCNIICPGIIKTRMNSGNHEELAAKLAKIPAGRIGTVEDVANAAVFLGCEDSSYIHGESILIDGGKNLRWNNL